MRWMGECMMAGTSGYRWPSMAGLRMIGETEETEGRGGEGEGGETGREIGAGAGQEGGGGGREPEANPDLRTGEGKGQEVRKARSQEV